MFGSQAFSGLEPELVSPKSVNVSLSVANRADPAQELATIDAKISDLFTLIIDGLAGATSALLDGDVEAAATLMERDHLVDMLYFEIEEIAQRRFALQAPVAADMRHLLSVLRIVPELERSGDLVEHIAQRAVGNLAQQLSPRSRGLIEQMGMVAVSLWRGAAEAYTTRDAEVSKKLVVLDDELDELQRAFNAELVASPPPTVVIIQMALVARFFERLGDHAVNVSNRLRYSALGLTMRTKPTGHGASPL